MNKRVKKLWIKALRSGEFRKTKDALRNVSQRGDRSYCCLGVLTELYRRERPQRGAWDEWGRFVPSLDHGDCSATELPKCVQRWAGLKEADPVLVEKTQTSAAGLNDKPKSFAYIADRIEKYL